MFEQVPGGKYTVWAFVALLVLVVIVAMRKGGSIAAYATLPPNTLDPNEAQVEQASLAAKGEAFGSVASVFRDAFASVVGGARDTNVAALSADVATVHDSIAGQVAQNGQYWDAATAMFNSGQETVRERLRTDEAVTVAGYDATTSRYLSDNQRAAQEAAAQADAARAAAERDQAYRLAQEETARNADNNRTQVAVTDSNNRTAERTAAGQAFAQGGHHTLEDYVFAAIPFIAALF